MQFFICIPVCFFYLRYALQESLLYYKALNSFPAYGNVLPDKTQDLGFYPDFYFFMCFVQTFLTCLQDFHKIHYSGNDLDFLGFLGIYGLPDLDIFLFSESD